MFFIREVILPAKYSFALSFTLAVICLGFPAYAQKKTATNNTKSAKKSQADPKSKVKESKDSKDSKTAKDAKKTDKKLQAKSAQAIVKDKVGDKKSKTDKSKTALKKDKNKDEKPSKAELAKQADKKRKESLKKAEDDRKREEKLKKEKALKEELAREAEKKRKESRKREEEERRREEARLAKIKREKLRRLEIARKAEQKRKEELRRKQLQENEEEELPDEKVASVPKKEVVITDNLPKPEVKKNMGDTRKSVIITDTAGAENAEREEIRKEEVKKEVAVRKRSFEKGLRAETIENIANDDITGEDLEVRRAAVNALGNRAGTVVVMEPQTGKVLTIVNQEWGIRKSFKPCSTIKLVTGVAGVNERVINQQGDIQSRRMRIGLDDALAHSNNSYFQAVGSTVGNPKMIDYARAMGLGEQTGINAAGESAGKLPYGNSNVRIYSHGDDFAVTPLQLAVMVSAISNGGKLVVPRIPKESYEKNRFQGYMRGEVKVPQPSLQRVLPGMLGAVNYGTAGRAYDDSINIAGKTGSCIGEGSWLGLFASVAPVVNPKLSVVVITRGQGERGKYASAIAGKIYKALGNRINGGSRELTAKAPLILKPQQKVTAKNSALLDNDEGEEADEGDANKSVKPQAAKPSAKKAEDANTSKQPAKIFDPVVIEVDRNQERPRVVITKP